MKTLTIFLVLTGLTTGLMSQTGNIPDEALITTDGVTVMSTKVFQSTTPVILVFWEMNSNKCCNNLDNMQALWQETLQEEGVKMIAVCIGTNSSWGQVKPMANGRNWEFEIYIDPNGNFKRAMNINRAPCTLLFDQHHELLCRQEGYCSGDEDMLCNKLSRFIRDDVHYTEVK